MKIKEWPSPEDQMVQLGAHEWAVSRLFELSRDFKVREAPLDCLNVYDKYSNLSLREMVMHFKAVLDADLSRPIILDEDGEIMDGRHRIMKALLEGKKTIKMVRFDENPSPCKVNASEGSV